MDKQRLRTWYQEMMKATGWSAAEWAHRAVTSPTNITRLISTPDTASIPRMDTLKKLLAVLPAHLQSQAPGLLLTTASELLGADGEEPPAEFREEPARFEHAMPTKARIIEVDVRGGLGGGGEALAVATLDEFGNHVSADAAKGSWDLPADYVRHELRVVPQSARLIEVKGDSMSPTLESGDRVMIDTGDRIPSPGGVFAIWDGLGVVVKRIEHIPNSDPPQLKIISDNPRHGEYERTVDEVNIIGRVVWFGRRL